MTGCYFFKTLFPIKSAMGPGWLIRNNINQCLWEPGTSTLPHSLTPPVPRQGGASRANLWQGGRTGISCQDGSGWMQQQYVQVILYFVRIFIL
jgi:hypothetical protein